MFGVDEEEIAIEPFAGEEDDPGTEKLSPHIDEIVERLEHPRRQFPIERAILVSLILHVLLILAVIFAPPVRPRPDLVAARSETPIPVHFFVPPREFVESPGPARPDMRRNAPLSDKTRRASGGDRSRPRSETPYVPPSAGMEGLAPGQRARQQAASRSPAPAPAPASPRGAGAPPSGQQTAQNSARGLVVPRGAASAGPAGQGRSGSAPDLNEAIREATGNPFAGEGGAPRSNPGGGFVDYGPISFDTQGYDWGDYAEEMLRKIKIHWYERIPKLFELGPDGELSIRFYIRKDGSVEGESVQRTSGIPPYDHAAFMGIADSDPFRPLPSDLHEDREGVTITFKYMHWRADQPPPRTHH